MNKQRYLSVSHKQSVITLLLIFFLFFSAITFIKLPTVKATQTTTANGMTITNPADITMSTLAELVSGQQFNLFVEIGDWHPDHTINYYDSNAYYTSELTLSILTIHVSKSMHGYLGIMKEQETSTLASQAIGL